MERIVKYGWTVPVVLWLVVLLLPALGFSMLSERQIILIGVYCLVTAGINLSFGFGGELALGQVAVMAAGAYSAMILGINGINDLVVNLVVGCVAGVLLGLVTGLPGLRLSKWSLGLTSFFLIMLLPSVVVALRDYTGGLEGKLISPPAFLGVPLTTGELYTATIVVVGVWLVIFRNLILSGYGVALRSFRESPRLVESLGHSATTMKLSSYVVGSIPAAMGGVLYAYLAGYISPAPFNLSMLLAVLAASVLGGTRSIYGSVIGAAILVIVPDRISSFEVYSMAIFGAFLVIVAVLFSHGIAGYLSMLTKRMLGAARESRKRAVPQRADGVLPDLSGGTLRASGVTKHFGGVAALDGAGVVAEPGRITAIIGSNGAGKTSLLNAISGFIRPESGVIEVDGTSISRLTAAAAARSGVSRAFQTPAIPDEMSVREIVASGMLRTGRFRPVAAILRLPSYRRARRDETDRAEALIALVGLDHLADQEAATLPLGTRRLLEVLRAAVGAPKVILLDEPAAGLDETALNDLTRLLQSLRKLGATIVLIEHNVPFVMSLADTVFAMHLGKVIASGDPEAVRNSPQVIESYLGRPLTVAVPETLDPQGAQDVR
ncbi:MULTISPECIES: ATP-binding cassette domain-containing protein [unclassified Rhodococcus (in: high G+C Gram-positive bacteria)]|uniref:branched-chain amino acid ABC transporter ATP-binding protein/permease n=1 Tax=unclassified Rhodococcus (in: high G+C Gram-positive bacteria) TaxID=192944 RepID=UPI00163A29E9|nr:MULTISPECIES: branched-chain amino acid ABC transporter ATP-binding protein/permease [unclassified Rhodococcus (in: high G+C Gram-positive bacteria)]MBC2640449.1 branched-chain amino acid ABC transporter ATP-binding protein/permease [Rhodococcus sp. 3A]MBC2894805.1 branched-chain amino acid ABC transporter ATP-binding protein/permease [Rhodococcus sp. 4CII]